jgi:hypothetical protein
VNPFSDTRKPARMTLRSPSATITAVTPKPTQPATELNPDLAEAIKISQMNA